MKIAITGGTGFVGHHFARSLLSDGHEVVIIARGHKNTDPTLQGVSGAKIYLTGLSDEAALAAAFAGCDAVAHCAGINREIGQQTYQRIHVEGTQHVVNAARLAGVGKIALISFLRARPNCGAGYHESKWAAEEIFRNSGLDYTILKAGVIYGQGDHMLDHLSHAFHSFPVFGLVGFQDRLMRPTAVKDIARILHAALVDGALSQQTVAVTGPEEMSLREAVCRVARVVGKQPLMFPLPVWFHYGFAWVAEQVMVVPLVSTAQVRILSEGLTEALPACATLPKELQPMTSFSEDEIRRGLPVAGGFTLADVRLSKCLKKC